MGLILVTPFGLWAAWSFDFGAVSGNIWLGLVLALAASMWTVWLWMTRLKRIPAAKAGCSPSLPLTSAIVGIVFLGERFTTVHLIAFGCAIAGVLLATWLSRTAASVVDSATALRK